MSARRLGSWRVQADFDGDGIAELTGSNGRRTLAISGKGGRVLWQMADGPGDMAAPRPHADLDGDGVPDLVGVCPPGEVFDPNLDRRFAYTGCKLWPVGTAEWDDPLKAGAQG